MVDIQVCGVDGWIHRQIKEHNQYNNPKRCIGQTLSPFVAVVDKGRLGEVKKWV